MLNILVTGGAGFIGSHIVDELINDNNKVVVLDDLSGGFRENVNRKAVFVKGSILDIRLIKDIFDRYKFDYVFHLAAYAAESLSHFIKNFNYNNNLVGSANLINESVLKGVKCFVFTSSIAVYGKNQVPMREDMIPRPEDSYGIAKFAVEQEFRITKEIFGLNYVIFRPHNVYGERQDISDKHRNVIGIFMNEIMNNKPLTIFGDGRQTRAFSYIKDVAPMIANSIKNASVHGEVFNIGADVPCAILELAEITARAMGVKANIVHLAPRNEVRHAYSDHSKVKKFFGETAATTMEEGINKMAEWAKRVGPKKPRKFKNIEIKKGLPEGWLD